MNDITRSIHIIDDNYSFKMLEDLMSILLEQEANLFNISSEEIDSAKLTSLQQAKTENKRAQDKLKEIMDNKTKTNLPIPSSSTTPITITTNTTTMTTTTKSAPTSPSSPKIPISPRSCPPSPLSLSWNDISFHPKPHSLNERERSCYGQLESPSLGADEDIRKEKEKKKSLAQLFFHRSKSTLSLQPVPMNDMDPSDEIKSNIIHNPPHNGRKRMTISHSTADLFRRKKDKPKKQEEVDNYLQIHENSKLLFEKKRDLLRSSIDLNKITKD